MTMLKISNRRGQGRGFLWLQAHIDYRYDDCLKWPFSRDTHGYGQLGHEGKVIKAHRKMCELKNGRAPTPAHEAAHSCGRGHQACINPNHLFWKTRGENQQDRTDNYGRGTPRYKLTEDDVAVIRSLFSSETNLAIAKRFDVTPGTISKIKNGKHWGDSRKRLYIHLRDDQIREIRSLFGQKTAREIADLYGVQQHKVERIKYGRAHAFVSGEVMKP